MQKRLNALKTIGIVLLLAASIDSVAPSASASGIPVFDGAALAQLIQQTQQYVQQIAMMANQIILLKQQIQSMTGHYGIGKMVGAVNPWARTTWNDIIGMVNAGVNPGDAAQVAAYKNARAGYVKDYPELDSKFLSANPRIHSAYVHSYQAGIAGMSAGQSIYAHLSTHFNELQQYKDTIEKTNTVKAAMDLNTAVGIKAAQIQAELLRTQALQLYVQANAQSNSTNGQSAMTEFLAN